MGTESTDTRSWHELSHPEALAAARSDPVRGLSRQDRARRLVESGPNALPEPPRRSPILVVLYQLKSPLVYLLVVAAGIALALGRSTDAAVIGVVVLLNAVIGAAQEGRAERSLRALRRTGATRARVIEDGKVREVPARDIVPGDVLVLAAGDAVVADGHLIEGNAVAITEAALTGESFPVAKHLLPLAPGTSLADRRNMVYAGTHVTAGRARAVVLATGAATEIGRIAVLAESTVAAPTPLERRVAQFGRYLVFAAAGIFSLIMVVGLLRRLPLAQIAMVGISQVIGIIPEGLPAAMTVALAVGVQRMARRHAVIRRLHAVETLGATTVICSDKTGTLTRNEMTVTAIHLPGGRDLEVSGGGYAPTGTMVERGRDSDPESDPALRRLLDACALSNDAQLLPPAGAETRWTAIGDPTEAALLTLAIKGGLVPGELRARFPRLAEIPFEAGAQMMATQHRVPAGGPWVLIKGAPEAVLELCATDEVSRRDAHEAGQRMAARGLRLLAFAEAEGVALDGHAGYAALAGRARLLGLVGEEDPPRPEVAAAVVTCRAAGIRPVMVTGDHRDTALAVARTLGLASQGDAAIDGPELDRMSVDELAARLEGVSVFARVHPAQKLRIVEAYQKRGDVVAMTGDGVNDAPALVRANVGVAMGMTGTDVAKEAAEVVVTDDNFATILAAVEEGRVVYRNIKKVILFLCTTSVAETAVLVATLLLGYPLPFTAVQILWNNLVVEGLVTINLIMEPSEGSEMRRPPTPVDEALLDRRLVGRLAFMSPAIVASTLGWFLVRISSGVPLIQVQTETLTLLVVCQWFNVLNCRSDNRSALNLGLLKNPWLLGGMVTSLGLQAAVVFWSPLGRIVGAAPLEWQVLLAIVVVGSLVLWVEETSKLVRRWRARARAWEPPRTPHPQY